MDGLARKEYSGCGLALIVWIHLIVHSAFGIADMDQFWRTGYRRWTLEIATLDFDVD